MNPQNFGNVITNSNNELIRMVEKPPVPENNWAVAGIYVFTPRMLKYFNGLEKEENGEFSLTEMIQKSLETEVVDVQYLGRGFKWYDTGTLLSFSQSSSFINSLETNSNYIFGSPEEIGVSNKWITRERVLDNIKIKKSQYFNKLRGILTNDDK